MHDPALIEVVTKLTEEFDRREIAWCVLRNYETFPRPRSDTSDLDILVDCSTAQAVEIVRETANWTQIAIARVFTKSDRTLAGLFLSIPKSPSLHVDLIDRITWRGTSLVSHAVVLAKRTAVNSIPIPMPGHEAAISLVSYLFHQGRVKDDYRSRIQSLADSDRSGFVACLSPIWGGKQSEELLGRTLANDWEWFSKWVVTAKRTLFLRSFRSPLKVIQGLSSLISCAFWRIAAPAGTWVAFVGPDGAGKTTVAEAYRERLSTLFYPANQRHLHWRPRWLPAPGQLAGRNEDLSSVADPHAKAPRGVAMSVLRLTYFWLDYLLGHWIKVRPVLAKSGLVTFDRYYQDFQVDPKRYRLRLPPALVRLVGRMVPQPELLFILDAPAGVLHARKQELPEMEIANQLIALRALAQTSENSRVVRVDRSVEEIVDELERLTLAHLDKRNRRRLGWGSLPAPLGSIL